MDINQGGPNMPSISPYCLVNLDMATTTHLSSATSTVVVLSIYLFLYLCLFDM